MRNHSHIKSSVDWPDDGVKDELRLFFAHLSPPLGHFPLPFESNNIEYNISLPPISIKLFEILQLWLIFMVRGADVKEVPP